MREAELCFYGGIACMVIKAVHLYVGTIKDNAIDINFAEKGGHIGHLKTSSKNINAKVVEMHSSIPMGCTAKIGLYATKKGIYTISFDILNSDEKRVSSHSVKVFANIDRAVESATFAGMPIQGFTDKENGKLSVTMNKGYTLKKIVVETFDKTGEQNLKTVKNNSMIALGKYAYLYENEEADGDYYKMTTSIMATTTIHIYYIDKYTKNEECEIYYMYRLAQ